MLNGNSGYGNSHGNSVTGADKAPTLSLVTWCMPVTVWHPSPWNFAAG